MSQGMISLDLSNEQLEQAQTALNQLEATLSALIALDVDDRRRLNKMGPKSEYFCRQALTALEQNPQIVPPSLNLPGAQADLRALDRLRPLLDRLQRLSERAADTEMALGSDLMNFALEAYGLLKVSGKNQGLDGLRKDLSARWTKPRRDPVTPPA
ncbi:hypothetical protein [Lysobacter silvisoli]|uniref:Uncharacterized protein n=1 Tax=Lysobacter silvisoli TaxID=2293254 RepID=A0A371K2N5_9GAMM|nr:hypothetical protein [Lysobacter silvisoli]RDZ28148.1 hypothetical protein DX914_03115 [Lysobacter silvisoli]